MAQFVKTIQNFAFQNNLLPKGAKIVVGVSGGPDSTCLLDVLSTLAKKYEFKLHICHVNYGLRDKDSERDEKFVQKLAEEYQIPLSVLNPSKDLYKENLENCLRKLRYDFFEATRKKQDFDLIAVAHNQDDQAETVLMRILRGAGLNGLSSMKPKSERLVRPLLSTSKREILAYLKEKKLPFRTDKTNLETNFLRNKIRLELLPCLEKGYNPAIKQTIASWSLNVAEDYEFIERAAEKFLKKNLKNDEISFNKVVFQKNHPAIQRQILRKMIEQKLGSSVDIESGHVDEILKIVKSTKGKSQKMTFLGLKISKKGDNITIFC